MYDLWIIRRRSQFLHVQFIPIVEMSRNFSPTLLFGEGESWTFCQVFVCSCSTRDESMLWKFRHQNITKNSSCIFLVATLLSVLFMRSLISGLANPRAFHLEIPNPKFCWGFTSNSRKTLRNSLHKNGIPHSRALATAQRPPRADGLLVWFRPIPPTYRTLKTTSTDSS